MAKKGTKNGQKRVEAEQSSYYREYPVAFGQKREIAGVGQSDTNNTICRYCFQVHPFLAKKAPGTSVLAVAQKTTRKKRQLWLSARLRYTQLTILYDTQVLTTVLRCGSQLPQYQYFYVALQASHHCLYTAEPHS